MVKLFLILLVAILLRLVHLSNFPPSLNWDEVSHGYNAYSLLKTGADQWGQTLPLINFRSYGDYPTPINLYYTIPAISILGLNEFSLRLPHALVGALFVPAVFAAAYYLTQNSTAAFLAGLFAAIEPWALFPSRAVFQSNWAAFFLAAGLVFYLKNSRLSFVFWGLSLFSYHNARIFVPLLVLALFLVFRKYFFSTIAVILLSIAILIWPSSRARNQWVGIINPGVVSRIEQSRRLTSLPPVLARLIYNRPVYFAQVFVSHYLDYLSPFFLFFHGGTQYQFSLPGFWLLSPITLPFFYWGLIILVKRRLWLPIIWLFLAPIPAAVTADRFAVIRSTAMLPVVFIVSSLGLARLKRPLIIGVLIAVFIGLESFLWSYFASYPRWYSQSWQYGYKQTVQFIKDKYSQYDQVIFTKKYGEPHEFVAFFWAWDPSDFQKSISWDYHANWYWVNSLDKFTFVNDWEMPQTVASLPPDKKYLIVSSPDNPTAGNQLTTINFLDSQPAFIIKEL